LNYNYLVIEGNIGSGKTSLTEKIAADFNAKVILEQFADNPFLPKFYENPQRYSFPLELSFLAERYHQLGNNLPNVDLFKNMTVADYYFAKSLVFARINLGEDEFMLYQKLFNIIYTSLPKPDLLVYLYLKPENLLKNIKKRGRTYEQNISMEYLEKVDNGYFDFFRQQDKMKIVIVNTNNIDFVSSSNDYNALTEALNGSFKTGISNIEL